jgi:hypothetical protein
LSQLSKKLIDNAIDVVVVVVVDGGVAAVVIG